uniref:non-specific serine/threonine protein kinase n=2 Tax=Cyprinus carpio TaxID=7962 RepID=A0A8C1AT20_CYPCA
MVRTWAEKEIRNLIRLQTAQIPSPEPIMLRCHVLVMSFIGRDDMYACAVLSESKAQEPYLQIIQNMRIMYNEARLVHADLSEFNMLYHNGDAYIIDVSQSVEHDHPHALEFLRKDCNIINVNVNFFQKHNVAVMTVRELFEFITDPSITSDNINQYLDKAMEIASERTAEDRSSQDKVDEEVFKKAYIPRTLTEVTHYERDVDTMLKKKEEASSEDTNTDNILYQTVTGLRKDLSGVQTVRRMPFLFLRRPYELCSWVVRISLYFCVFQERKKMVKEAQREKRKNKVPKHEKKSKEKVAKIKKGR